MYYTVKDNTERDSIPVSHSDIMTQGVGCYVTDTGLYYELAADLRTWQLAAGGPGGQGPGGARMVAAAHITDDGETIDYSVSFGVEGVVAEETAGQYTITLSSRSIVLGHCFSAFTYHDAENDGIMINRGGTEYVPPDGEDPETLATISTLRYDLTEAGTRGDFCFVLWELP